MPNIQGTGSVLITADAAVGTSAIPTYVSTINIISGGTPAIVSLRNGTSTSGTIYVTETGTVSTGKTVYYGNPGILFPSGCFVDVDTNTSSVLVSYSQ